MFLPQGLIDEPMLDVDATGDLIHSAQLLSGPNRVKPVYLQALGGVCPHKFSRTTRSRRQESGKWLTP